MGSNNHFANVTRFSPGTPFVEAFGLLTASLLLHDGQEGGLRTICVTAAQLGEGVSTTALNLALSLAGSGRRTLLVDSNFRSPDLHRAFNVPVSPGLVDVLARKVALKDAVRATKTSNLYLLPAGSAELSPQALLQPKNLEAVFDQIKSGYDIAVIDTPPALRYPDALHLGRCTQGVVLIVPADGTQRRAALEVRRRLERANVNILGIVLNRTSSKEATTV